MVKNEVSIIELTIENPENEVRWLGCINCHEKTEHRVLSSVVKKQVEKVGNNEEEYWWQNSHLIIQCKYCDLIDYHQEYIGCDSANASAAEFDPYKMVPHPGNQPERIFERYKIQVDERLRKDCGDVIQKIPEISKRLEDGSSEAISQALNSCRRMIKAFAQSVYPAPTEEVEIDSDGKRLNLSSQNYLNLIEAYVRSKTSSSSVRDRIRQTLRSLNDRVCAGVHDDVTPEEARSLFLQTYVLVGEILNL